MLRINEIIAQNAKMFIGQKEVSGNKSFIENKTLPYFKKYKIRFLNMMMKMGWKKGHAWCAYFAELVWKLSYQEYDATYLNELDRLFSASAVQTYKNFANDVRWKKLIKREPAIGALAVWQVVKKGNYKWYGHIAIVTDFNDKYMITVDGNTNEKGSREGTTVLQKTRTYDWYEDNGKRLIGFIHSKI